MKKTLAVVIILSVLTGLSLSAQAWGRRGAKPAQLTYHREIQKVLPDPSTTLLFSDGRPTVVATDESIRFLSPTEQVLKTLERTQYTRVFFGGEADYIGIQEIVISSKKPEGPRSITFTLYDVEGQDLWSWKQSLEYDDPLPGVHISAKGQVVMVESLEGRLIFFEKTGTIIREVQLFGDVSPETERSVICAFSANGQYLAVNAIRQYARAGSELSPREKGHSFLILFQATGEEIWRRELPQEISNGVGISPDGEIIVAGAHSVVGMDALVMASYLYNRQGELLATLDIPFRHARFSWDGQFLLLGQKNNLELVETITGRVLWEKNMPADAGQVRDMDLDPEGNLALVMLAQGSYQGSRFVYHHPQVFLFDHQGRQVWQQDFPEDRFLQPLARFHEDGAHILLAFQNRYLIYAQDK